MALLKTKKPSNSCYHFYVCEPKQDEDYAGTLTFVVRKISKTRLSLDSCLHDQTEGMQIVRVRLRLSEDQPENITLEVALHLFCEGMLDDENRSYLESLTRWWIGGIVPLCPIFKAHWTSLYFQKTVGRGAEHLSSFLHEAQNEARSYISPTILILGFAVLAGVGSCFAFLNSGINFTNPENVNHFCNNAFSHVIEYFQLFVDRNHSRVDLTVQELEWKVAIGRFKVKFDALLDEMATAGVAIPSSDQPAYAIQLFQGRQIPYATCAKLYDVTEAAMRVHILRKDLFDVLVSARREALLNSGANAAASAAAAWSIYTAIKFSAANTVPVIMAETGGVVSTVGAGATLTAAAACWPVIVFAGGVCVVTASKAVLSHRESTVIEEKLKQCAKVHNSMKAVWSIAYDLHNVMMWFRYSPKEGPSTTKSVQFRDVESEIMWNRFISSYRTATGQGAITSTVSQAGYILTWADEQTAQLRALMEDFQE
ncbi:uncharacterized protein Z518_03662 [Rhinocladiella mackenziei CBS 650.93]|uniref:Uncharacterized protein n=1 Tax=Rhinocladiella mackenziei CBS 650.93 TaxID=1442369 RepID=A0A0D2J991_9EURO|nr:uncharacterized protein Z518_03662 [Rhinocladiella mackenziei CBS 650.93]KIX05690.1 hypothetical protein Z518_03662 [Rhinocladiella mackenziei CBS 650.93]